MDLLLKLTDLRFITIALQKRYPAHPSTEGSPNFDMIFKSQLDPFWKISQMERARKITEDAI